MNSHKAKRLAKEFFTKEYRNYGDVVTGGQNLENLDIIYQEINKYKKNNITILDVACGLGFLANYLSLKFKNAKIYGVDISDELISIAKSHQNNNTYYQVADSENLPFQNKSFDFIICRFAFHHFPSPENVLKEMKRVLKDNGKILIVDPLFLDIELNETINNIFEKVEKKITGHNRFHNKNEYEKYTLLSGLNISKLKMFNTNFNLGLEGFKEQFSNISIEMKKDLEIIIDKKVVNIKLPIGLLNLEKFKN